MSCGGATTANITGPQSTVTGPNPPRLGAVTAITMLVTTLGIAAVKSAP